MTAWINNLPPDMASAIDEISLFDHLAPFRAILTATFGNPPELSSDRNIDDIDHLKYPSLRAEFFQNLLNRLNSTFPVNQIFFLLSTTPIACTWSHSCTRDKPALASTLLQFLVEIQSDITLLRSCATLLSQVLGGASSAAIWQSTFEILNPPAFLLPALPVSPTTPEAAPHPQSEVLLSSDLPHLSSTSIDGPSSTPTGNIKTRQTPIKPNSGTSLYQTGTHQEVDPRIRAELKGLTFPNTPGFMDAFFSRFQATATETLLQFASSRSDDCWTAFPSPPGPLAVESWYLTIANQVLASTGADRRYRASPTRPLTGHESFRKPDLILLDSSVAAGAQSVDVDWSDVLVVGELKQGHEKALEVDTIVQLAGYIRIIFATQPTRRFVHGFTLCSDFMRCWVFHRGGAFGSDEFNINTDPNRFLSAILGYAAMSDQELGFDPTLSLAHEGITVGDMNDKITLSAQPFFCPPAIASRGTKCWKARLVTDTTVRYVLKDSWRSIHHRSEGELLAKARDYGVIGIVEFIAYEDVMVDDKLDDLFANVMKGLQVGKAINMAIPQSRSTSQTPLATDEAPMPASKRKSILSIRVRELSAGNGEDPPTPPSSKHQQAHGSPIVPTTSGRKRPLPSVTGQESTTSSRKRVKTSTVHASTLHFRGSNRIHTRILTKIGRNITTFTSAHELLLAFSGAIKGHQSLYRNGILHRDVSINNIMITFADQPRPDRLSGFLIDLDLAIEMSDIVPSGAPHRTGTMEFMAIGALNGEVHTFRHDLESFLYVLVWICINYRPTLRGISRPVRLRKTVLDRWGDTFEGAAIAKWGDMGRATAGSRQGLERILGSFEGWAMELKDLVRSFRDILFPITVDGVRTFSESSGLYREILKLFEDYVQRL